ncbi:MAG TPA: FkbM family methyltransferase [Capillimicrobium sp.]
MADPASYRNYRLLDRWRRQWPDGAPPLPMRLRPLGGARVWGRPRSSDSLMLRETFQAEFHTPPPEARPQDVRWIVDLGANIGLTIAHNAVRYPHARFLAVELDPANAALARRNIEPWADRVELIEAAVWTEDGVDVPYAREPGNEYGFHVTLDAGGPTQRSLSIDTLLTRLPADARVDFMKMDLEGIEPQVLTERVDWAARVDAIRVEIHGDYRQADCARDLSALGFEPRFEPHLPAAVTGVRPAR